MCRDRFSFKSPKSDFTKICPVGATPLYAVGQILRSL